MLNVAFFIVILSVVMLGVVVLTVAAPKSYIGWGCGLKFFG